MAKQINCNVVKKLDVLHENDRGYTKEINLISWSYALAKLNIREWHPEHKKYGKDITLSERDT